jgi:hypothetical protein
MGFQFVLEVFVAQKIKAVPADSTQHSVHHSSREHPVGSVKEWAQSSHQEHQAPARHSCGESLGVPGKEGHRLHSGQVKQAALDAPIDRDGRTGLPGMWS